MLVQEKKFQEKDGTIGYYDAVYDSSNILQTTYFPKTNRLYISFNRGGVYSYENVDVELYEKFKTAESQGKFFAETIKNQPKKYLYRKEFTLYPEEVKNLKEVVEDFRKQQEEDDEEILIHIGETEFDTYEIGSAEDPNNIVFSIEDEEWIRINPEGFFWKGELVKEDHEIYEKFKAWVDWAYNQIPRSE